MFSRAQEFNQPVAAWDAGQVTNMKVRRRPRRDLGKHLTASAAKRRVRVCWRGAGHVRSCEGFQPASSCMGCWSSRRHGGAPPPALGVSEGRGMSARAHELHGQAWGDFLCVCGGTVRRRCSTAHTGSTSPWLRGTLVRSPPWRCAAAHVEAGGGRPSAHKPARRRICFTTRPISTSPWLHGTLARSPACGCAAACLSGQEGLGGSRAHLLLGEAASRACVLWRGAGDVQRPHRFDWLQPVAHPREL